MRRMISPRMLVSDPVAAASPTLCARYNSGYTEFMKTAISIPDSIFAKAEVCARRLGMSRSELFTKAVAAFIEEHGREGLTVLLDRVYSRERSILDEGLAAMQAASIDSEQD